MYINQESICIKVELFCSVQALDGLVDAYSHWWGTLLYSVYQVKCLSCPETPLQTYPEIKFYQLSGHPFAQSSCHVKLTNRGSLLMRSQATKNNLNRDNQGRRRNQNIWFHLVHICKAQESRSALLSTGEFFFFFLCQENKALVVWLVRKKV